ncbi:MAG: branched-chain amino acid ABC transporter permease [Deltaproteobacteria bacterium]|nr:branched-chain amino acid ABC transporter permease [Deltaproteobacteria bacterium]MBW2009213.1 branched-chain amino acid ABC transporter permease [Deltaproteobacteria bacterium]MBW2103161.1 branched-chain amino acid ABC transporter permease [Deltaproteobacteria bacterium]MBW2348295.1 branched-chain amino acid ABC transporter permease [Deltaproteobacteria bacterium]RLB38168.1 MAG: branched-chain amino acid ABC transporter permease [Deltaproteobacteria bacterium]
MAFFFEVLINGLLVGVMYSLVALGFALIYKASDVFNFAQGDMSLLAGLALVGFLTVMPLWLAILCTIGVMTILAYGTVYMVFRPLLARPPLILFMAAIGLSFLVQGIGQAIWGTDAKGLNIGIPDNPIEFGEIWISSFDLIFGAVAGILVLLLVLFFQKTRTGRALRAVADDHEAALSVGIPLLRAWAVTWVVAGIVATVAGIAWGSRLGVQFSLSLIALKALPVLILGGIDSIPGAILAGLVIGAGENLAEVFLGPYVGGGIQTFFPYLVALIFLWFKPYGMFGKEIIERV